MVKAARKASRPGALRPLNQPEPARVQAEAGCPVAVLGRGAASRREVTSVEDVWRVEEEWWRDSPIVRTYFEVLLDDGRRTTLFYDHAGSCWYVQRYG